MGPSVPSRKLARVPRNQASKYRNSRLVHLMAQRSWAIRRMQRYQMPGDYSGDFPFESIYHIACAFLPVYIHPAHMLLPTLSSIEGNSFKLFHPTQILARRVTLSGYRTFIDYALSSILPRTFQAEYLLYFVAKTNLWNTHILCTISNQSLQSAPHVKHANQSQNQNQIYKSIWVLAISTANHTGACSLLMLRSQSARPDNR